MRLYKWTWTSGQVCLTGYLRSLGLWVKRRRVRECLVHLDPQNRVLGWGIVVSRRVYQVPWPNSLWHLDRHHSLIHYKLIINGCIDGFSRHIIYLRCSSNNLAETVLNLSMNAVGRDGDHWPSRIKVVRGVENILVCDAMVQYRGEWMASFIAGSSTHNQRIECLWREVYRCVCHLFYYTFYAVESSGLLNVEDLIQLFVLHTILIPILNFITCLSLGLQLLVPFNFSTGGHISQKWYEFTTDDQEINRYGWVYRLVIENVNCCNWDYQLVIEIVNRCGWDYQVLIKSDGRYGLKSDWIPRLTIAMVEKKIGVWKRSYRDWRSRTPTTTIEKSNCSWEMERPGNERGIVHVFKHVEVFQELTLWSKMAADDRSSQDIKEFLDSTKQCFDDVDQVLLFH